MSTLDNWPSAMYDAIDGVGVDVQPVKNAHPEAAIFFLVAIVINAFFMVRYSRRARGGAADFACSSTFCCQS